MLTFSESTVMYLASLTGFAAALIAAVVLVAWLLTICAGQARVGVRHYIWIIALVCTGLCPVAVGISQFVSLPFAHGLALNWQATIQPTSDRVENEFEYLDETDPKVTDSTASLQSSLASSEPSSPSPRVATFADAATIQSVELPPEVNAAFDNPNKAASESLPVKTRASRGVQLINLLSIVWTCGIVLGVIRVCYAIRRLRLFRQSSITANRASIVEIRSEICKRIGLRKQPELRLSKDDTGPFLSGVLAPVVYLPESIVDDTETLRGVLLHECSHLAHSHQWLGLLQRFLRIVLWWHPAIHYLNARLSEAMELICDDRVAQSMSPTGYAELLFALSQQFRRGPENASLCMVAHRTALENRITQVLRDDRVSSVSRKSIALLMAAFASVMIAGTLLASPVEEEPVGQEIRLENPEENDTEQHHESEQGANRKSVSPQRSSQSEDKQEIAPRSTTTPVTFADEAPLDFAKHEPADIMKAIPADAVNYIHYQAAATKRNFVATTAKADEGLSWFAQVARNRWKCVHALEPSLGLKMTEIASLAGAHDHICVCLDRIQKQHSYLIALTTIQTQQELAKDPSGHPLAKFGFELVRVEGIGSYAVLRKKDATKDLFFAYREGVMLMSDSSETLVRSLNCLGESATRLVETDAHESVGLTGGLDSMRPNITWFSDKKSEQQLADFRGVVGNYQRNWARRNKLPAGFLDAVDTIGGTITMPTTRDLQESKTFIALNDTQVFMPAVASDRSPIPIPKWMPSNIQLYADFSFEPRAAHELVSKVVDEVAGEPGFFGDLLASFKEDPSGPQVDLKAEFIRRLTGDVHFAILGNQCGLLSLTVDSPQDVAKLVQTIGENDPTAVRHRCAKAVVWETLPMEDVVVPGRPAGQNVVSDDSVVRAMAVIDNQLILSSDAETLKQISGHDNEARLKHARLFKSLAGELAAIQPKMTGRLVVRGGYDLGPPFDFLPHWLGLKIAWDRITTELIHGRDRFKGPMIFGLSKAPSGLMIHGLEVHPGPSEAVEEFATLYSQPSRELTNLLHKKAKLRFEEYLLSFQSLDCEYTFQYSNDRVFHEQRIAFSENKWRKDFRLDDHFTSFDGERVFFINGGRRQILEPDSQHVHYFNTPMVFTGRSLSSTNQTLLRILGDSEVKTRSATLNGVKGFRLTFDSVPSRSGDKSLKVSVFVDEETDYAPRQISVRFAGEVPYNLGWQQIWTVDEFSLVPDFATGDLRWFPKLATLKQSENAPTCKMHISRTRINPDLPDDLFRPMQASN